ncbi:hypothetical protein [Jiangella gansuensis]|uniref:hypothetical protein n=1 Tax=Jiangella gansuensis TaxID=281473 RepID=UPI00047A6589|nr:hypothetical protein [Jiangella gansuensis]
MRPPDRLRHPRTTATLTVRRAWPRGAGHVLLDLGGADGSRCAGQWFADPDRRASVAAATPGAVDLPDDGVVLQPGGADRRLPVLAELVRRPGSRLLVHRPERRAVVRLRWDGEVAYAKVVRPGRSADLAERLGTLGGGPFAVPRVLDHRPDDGVVVLSELPGPTLHEAGAEPGRDVTAAWRSAGEALRHLQDGAGGPVPGARHDAADEVTVSARWATAAADFGLLPAAAVADALDGTSPLVSSPPGPEGVLHRDLHDKQLVLSPDGLGLLDLDTLAVGERALDVANLLVHLDLRVAQGLLTARRSALARAAFLDGAALDARTSRRVPAYAWAARVRLAGVYAFRPRWRRLAAELLESAMPRADDPRRMRVMM